MNDRPTTMQTTADASGRQGARRDDALSAAIAAIVRGEHGDPFAVLGMHETPGGVTVRAFLPEASEVSLVDRATGEAAATMERIDPAGFFAVTVERRRFAYRFRAAVDGTVREFEDPYRFPPILGELDVYLLAEGNHLRMFEKLGAHPMEMDGVAGIGFAVWAPNAQRVSVVGDFNRWDGRRHVMRRRIECGVWEIFLPSAPTGALYKFEIRGPHGELLPLKADPLAFSAERSPGTASVTHGLPRHEWNDRSWMETRQRANDLTAPMSIYECHLGSWMRVPEEGGRYLSYRELTHRLVPYVKEMGFTHLELLPITEYPFDGSWGYQPIGLYAPTSRFGPPEDFTYFVDRCHQEGIGVLLDWVPGHFPADAHGLARFDGTALYEHADPRQGFHQDWNTLIYNYGRAEVTNYLLADALFWLEAYHLDGLRVDAVASMLYLDYSRKPGEWIPNRFGGNENLEAIAFLKRMNELLFGRHPGATSIAEESTAWPAVSRPVHLGGLGFGYKWNMGWMHDTLRYMSKDPVHRKFHHHDLTFGLLYAFTENFILPLSHDEVVHGKGSLINKMPGDRWQKFANLRAYFGFMFAHPGKKLLFMGAEIAQEREWNHDTSLDWHLLDDPMHGGMQALVRDLNHTYRSLPALHEVDFRPQGFEWIVANDSENSVLAFLRRDAAGRSVAVVVCNFTPIARQGYRIGVPWPGWYREAINSDAAAYGGSNVGNAGGAMAQDIPWHQCPYSIELTLPPLGTLIFAHQPG